MPSILSPFKPDDGPYQSIGSSIRSLGQSIWGDEAKNEGLRQNALKLQRENDAREKGSAALRNGDATETLAQGFRGDVGAGDANSYLRGYYANRYGAKSPQANNAAAGAGQSWDTTPQGAGEVLANKRAMEQDRTDASKYTPIYNQDPLTGEKKLTGAFSTRTGGYQPMGGEPTGFNQPGQPAPRMAPMNVANTPLVDENAPQDPRLLTGKDALEYHMKTNPDLARRAVQVLQGLEPPPRTGVRFNAVGNQIMNIASQIEPGFNQTAWIGRYKTAQDFSPAGASGKRVTGLEQSILHTENMARASDALHNKNEADLPAYMPGFMTHTYNTAKNAYARESGHPEPNNFETMRGPWSDEMAGLFKRTGTMTDAEIAHWRSVISTANSPDELHGAIRTAMEALQHSVETLEDQRARGMGTYGLSEQPPLLNQRTKDMLGSVNAWAAGGKLAAPSGKDQVGVPQGAPQPVVTPQSQAGPGPQGPVNGAPQPPRGFHQAPDGRWYSASPGPNGRFQEWTP